MNGNIGGQDVQWYGCFVYSVDSSNHIIIHTYLKKSQEITVYFKQALVVVKIIGSLFISNS